MAIAKLRPAGEPIRLHGVREVAVDPKTLFSPFSVSYYGSGTAALAAAILAAKARKPVRSPEVLLPAYACPDLVSAAVYAGAHPTLVDLQKGSPHLNLRSLEERVSPNTVAVVGVSFLGIPENLAAIRTAVADHDVALIADCAQTSPADLDAGSDAADLTVLSFGRGKPVSVLGGGAVLYKEGGVGELLPAPDVHSPTSAASAWKYIAKTLLYNYLISPSLYWVPSALPFLHLGETRFEPLHGLPELDTQRIRVLPSNLMAHRTRDRAIQHSIRQMVASVGPPQVTDLASSVFGGAPPRLLRYPLWVEPPGLRDRLYLALQREGLGPSLMYPAVLPDLPGVGQYVDRAERFEGAKMLARSILTLPVHSAVTGEHIDKAEKVISRELSFFQ